MVSEHIFPANTYNVGNAGFKRPDIRAVYLSAVVYIWVLSLYIVGLHCEIC